MSNAHGARWKKIGNLHVFDSKVEDIHHCTGPALWMAAVRVPAVRTNARWLYYIFIFHVRLYCKINGMDLWNHFVHNIVIICRIVNESNVILSWNNRDHTILLFSLSWPFNEARSFTMKILWRCKVCVLESCQDKGGFCDNFLLIRF